VQVGGFNPPDTGTVGTKAGDQSVDTHLYLLRDIDGDEGANIGHGVNIYARTSDSREKDFFSVDKGS
jgi:hypothetical protein